MHRVYAHRPFLFHEMDCEDQGKFGVAICKQTNTASQKHGITHLIGTLPAAGWWSFDTILGSGFMGNVNVFRCKW